MKYGFARDRLSAAGYAEYHPIASNDSPETRAQNRRVDVVILGKPPTGLPSSPTIPANPVVPSMAISEAATPAPQTTPASSGQAFSCYREAKTCVPRPMMAQDPAINAAVPITPRLPRFASALP